MLKSSYEDFFQVVEVLVCEVDDCFDQQGLVGIGILGMLEMVDGMLYVVNVLVVSGWLLCVDFSVWLGCEVCFDNDVNCFVLLEVWDDEFM